MSRSHRGGVGGIPGERSPALTWRLFLGSIKQLHERVTQECSEYRALYEKMVLPPDVGPRVDWAHVLEQKQVRGGHTRMRSQGAQSHTRCSQRARQNGVYWSFNFEPGGSSGIVEGRPPPEGTEGWKDLAGS